MPVTFLGSPQPEGRVTKAHMIESFGGEQFINAAQETIKTWQYKPKKLKDTPVAQYATNVKVEFKKGGKRKISGEFGARKYNKISNLISDGEFDDALNALKKLDFEKLENMQEINLSLSLWGQYAKAIGDKELQLAYLEKMNLNTDKDDEKFMFSSLREKLILQFEYKRLINIKRTFSELKKVKVAKPYLPAFQKVMDQVDALADSDRELMVPGKIILADKWRHALARKSFSVQSESGSIEAASLRCNNKLKSLPLNKLSSVKIPNHWSNCYLDILGGRGTAFTVIEHPSK